MLHCQFIQNGISNKARSHRNSSKMESDSACVLVYSKHRLPIAYIGCTVYYLFKATSVEARQVPILRGIRYCSAKENNMTM